MKKYNIMGHEMVKLSELRDTIRIMRRGIKEDYTWCKDEKERTALRNGAHDAITKVVRQIYWEELKDAKAPEEIKAILEMPGDFVVVKPVRKDTGVRITDVLYFREWKDGKPVITRIGPQAMIFTYESKAQEIAERLGEEWRVFDTSPTQHEFHKRLHDAILGETDEDDVCKGSAGAPCRPLEGGRR